MAERRLKVLIVEDDIPVSEYYRHLVSGPFDAEVVSTAADGIARLAKEPIIDAIVLDLHLPNGKGLALVRQFEEAHPEIPIIAVSGFEFETRDIIKAGAQDFLRKPFTSPKDLLDAIARSIARHKVRKIFQPVAESLASMTEAMEKRIK